MPQHFQRYRAPDAVVLAAQIERARGALAEAQARGHALDVIERAGELAGMLTTDRREGQARDLLVPLLDAVAAHRAAEPAGWYYLAFGTASQYLGLREEANRMFDTALQLARAQAWEALEHYALSHWGRSLVEEGHYVRARECFEQALAIRRRLGDPRAEASVRALAALDELERGLS